jgi:hypothetical protein
MPAPPSTTICWTALYYLVMEREAEYPYPKRKNCRKGFLKRYLYSQFQASILSVGTC